MASTNHQIQDRSQALLKALAVFCVVNLVIMIGLALQVQARNEAIEDVQGVVADTQTSVDHLEAFVDDLENEEETPEEAAQNQAINEAVRRVPLVYDILCEQFSQATACQEG